MSYSADEFIIRCIANLRILMIRNICYFEEHGFGEDIEPYKKIVDASLVTRQCNKLIKYGYLESENLSQSYIFNKEKIVEDPNSSSVNHYYITQKGIDYFINCSVIANRVSGFRSINSPIYTAINAAFLPFIDRLVYTFDGVRYNRGPICIHENHAEISLQYIKLTHQFQILYKKTKIGIRFLTKSEISDGYIKFLVRKLLAKSNEFDWMIFIIKEKHYRIHLPFLKEYNRDKIYQRLHYTKETNPLNLSSNNDISTKHLLIKSPLYEGGCPVSILSVEECFSNLKKGIIDEFKV